VCPACTKRRFSCEERLFHSEYDGKATQITVKPSRVPLGPQQSIVVDGVRMLLLLLLVLVADEWRPEDD